METENCILGRKSKSEGVFSVCWMRHPHLSEDRNYKLREKACERPQSHDKESGVNPGSSEDSCQRLEAEECTFLRSFTHSTNSSPGT